MKPNLPPLSSPNPSSPNLSAWLQSWSSVIFDLRCAGRQGIVKLTDPTTIFRNVLSSSAVSEGH
jgi:hypothetical protein